MTLPLPSMTLRQLDWALRARGPDLAAWPATDRLAALALLRASRAARTLLADALALDDARTDCVAPGYVVPGHAAPGQIGNGPLPGAQLPDYLADPAALARMQGALRDCMARTSPLLSGIRWGVLAACAVAGLYVGMAGSAGADSDAFATVQSLTVASAL